MDWISNPQLWVALLTLTVLEIVLGIDNVIFISILSAKLPVEQRAKARQIGLTLALVTRVLLLLSLSWIMGLTKPLFTIPLFNHPVSGRDLILILGGLFLMWKSVHEIHAKLEGSEEHANGASVAKQVTMGAIIGQILVMDIIFSLDSVITAVGMVKEIAVMVTAVVIAIGVMLVFAGKISDFVEAHPTVKMLALAFLLLIGVNLLAEGFHHPIEKGYTYFAMAFSVAVEMLNLKLRRGRAIHLKGPKYES